MGQLTLMLFLKEDWARSADPEPVHFLSDNTAPQVLEVHAREMGCRLHPAFLFLERPEAVQIAALRKGTREGGGHSFPRPLYAGRWVLGKLVSSQRLSTNPAEVFQESREAALLLRLPWPSPEARFPVRCPQHTTPGLSPCAQWGMQA